MPQGKGTYGSTVGRPPKKNSPMGYNPFKMKGHTLPGIKQRTPANMNTFGVDSSENPKKIATSPGKFLGGLVGGIGGSWKKMRDKMEQHKAAAKEKAQAKFAERVQGVGVTPHGDEAHTGGGAEAGAEAAPEAEGAMMDQAMTSEQADPVVGAKMAKVKREPSDRGMIGGLFSDIRLKEKIERAGVSPSGIPIYEFNYIGSNNRYSGAMAQDLLEINPDAVMMDTSGYYKVNYDNIDVDMRQINN